MHAHEPKKFMGNFGPGPITKLGAVVSTKIHGTDAAGCGYIEGMVLDANNAHCIG